MSLQQTPPPGHRVITRAGDAVTFRLTFPHHPPGQAFLRTTAGNLVQRRREIISAVEGNEVIPHLAWHDLPMPEITPGVFEITLSESEIGSYEARSCFASTEAKPTLYWPETQGNVTVKIEPAWTGQGLSIYSALPRLFSDPNALLPEAPVSDKELAILDAAGYTVIPPSGTLRQLANQLPHIIEDMGFRIVLLAPIFPTPTTYARMGRFGSPFAPCDFYTVDPALAEFDQLTTPLDQLHEVIDGVHRRDGYIFLDIPINHTGWAARMMALHPEWYERDRDGKFQSPGAWGVVWEDLAELHYDDVALWQEMAAVLLHWCRQGIDGFRCDAGYMIPTPVWEYLTAKVRAEFPDTIFLLEGLGGPIAKMQELLDRGGLNWAYSELFQNYDRGAIHHYLPQALTQSRQDGLQVNFSETHDNLRLAAQGQNWSRMRTALCALTSPQGAWGITCGVEWYAAEKIDVHSRNSLNWGSEHNLIAYLAQLNSLLATHPAFAADTRFSLITSGSSETLALLRTASREEHSVLILANLDSERPAEISWSSSESPFPAGEIPVLFDSASATTSLAVSASGDDHFALLTAGQVVAVAWASRPSAESTPLQSNATSAVNAPRLTGGTPVPLVTTWQYPQDLRREVVWLEETDLLIRAAYPFDVRLQQGNIVLATARARQAADGNFTTTVAWASRPLAKTASSEPDATNPSSAPRLTGGTPVPLALELHIHEPTATKRLRSPLWCARGLPGVAMSVLPQAHHFAVLTNQCGALCQVHGHWGLVSSQYDTFFGANLDPNVPVDRRMLLGRLRIWITRKGYSTPLEGRLVKQFRFLPPGQAQWDFSVPCGDGHTIQLRLTHALADAENRVTLTIERLEGDPVGEVQLIIRPDLEDRGFHEKSHFPAATAAAWLATCDPLTDGLHRHREDGTHFHLWLTESTYTAAPEVVGVGHAVDAERGQTGGAELFSPGWFDATLPVGGTRVLTATVTDSALQPIGPIGPISPVGAAPVTSLAAAAANSLRQFIVKRDDSLTIIAGYPWFLDWGRDTLICLRGVIAAGWWKMAREVLITFARFEKAGTLPNMIRGHDDSNRDTVDAPLWFFVAVGELLTAEGNDSFLHESVQGRTIAEILSSIAKGYLQGTPNGIRVDTATGLVYSPSHFTWMDTNHPAGTPREGYPICAQAKWYYALKLLARIDPADAPRWTELAERVSHHVRQLFVRPGQPWLSDCLHATSGQSALEAVADDHFRPNQLLAITLGLITEPDLQRQIVQACTELIVPGALRTLADREVSYPLLVERHGHRLNNPQHPFWPYYTGDEDTRRKPAYHNGTAWPWLMPMLAEAMAMSFGDQGRTAGLSLLGTAQKLFAQGALGNIAEILDAAIPHSPKGCGAQAWSVSELVRVLAKLQLE